MRTVNFEIRLFTDTEDKNNVEVLNVSLSCENEVIFNIAVIKETLKGLGDRIKNDLYFDEQRIGKIYRTIVTANDENQIVFNKILETGKSTMFSWNCRNIDNYVDYIYDHILDYFYPSAPLSILPFEKNKQ